MSEDAGPDPFFTLDGDTEWNAYVGRQADEHAYVDGYIEAALELAASVIDNRKVGSRDTFVMPILYNARHGVELALKRALRQLRGAAVHLGEAPQDHDIVGLWRRLGEAELGDEALTKIVSDLRTYVFSLGQVDEDGQEFRYPYRRDGRKSLEDRGLANLQRIRASLGALQEHLQLLDMRVDDILLERAAGAFTAECSRRDLLEIARLLPPRADWAMPDFDEAKAQIQARFGLSGKAFSRALKVIEATREMAVRIGVEAELLHLSDDKVMAILDIWSAVHPPRKPSLADRHGLAGIINIRDLARDVAAEHAADQAALELLSPDDLADLQAVFYLGRNRDFGEYYEADVARVKAEHRAANDPREAVNHLMSKTNLARMMAEGARRAGRPSLAARIRAWRPDLFA